jgi:hypothetical protein
MSAVTTNPYKILQVDQEASPEVIEAAFRRLAKMNHPDVSSGRDAVERMAGINTAHDLLEDPVSRRSIDQDLARQETDHRPRTADARPSTPSATPPPTEDPAPQPVDYEPSPARRAASTAEPRAPWHETPKRDGQAQRVIAVITFLVFVVTPLFDRFSEPFITRFATGMAVWGVILVVELVLDAPNWRMTPLGEILRLGGRLLKRLVLSSVWAAKTLGTTLVRRLRRARRTAPAPEID